MVEGEHVTRTSEPAEGHRVLVVGAGRSGTTWVGEVLGRATDAAYVHEPDNIDWVPFAGRARAGLGLLPAVDVDGDAPDSYTRLWEGAFSARRRPGRNRLAARLYAGIPDANKYAALAPHGRSRSLRYVVATRLARPEAADVGARHRVVKSVAVPLALEWLASRFGPEVVLVRRHPLDVLGSRIGFGAIFVQNAHHYVDERAVATRLERWSSPPRPARDEVFANFVWMAAFTMSAYEEVAASHPDFHVVDHESLRADPLPQFRSLVAAVGLQWSDGCEEHLRASDVPGTGFETKRVSGTSIEGGRARLSSDQQRVAREILARFPVARRYADIRIPR